MNDKLTTSFEELCDNYKQELTDAGLTLTDELIRKLVTAHVWCVMNDIEPTTGEAVNNA